jgi:hypothetical protein
MEAAAGIEGKVEGKGKSKFKRPNNKPFVRDTFYIAVAKQQFIVSVQVKWQDSLYGLCFYF